MLEVVFFDLGGVVVNVDIDRGAKRFAHLTGLPVQEFHRAFFTSGIKDRLDVGTLGTEQAFQQIQELTGALPAAAKEAMESVLSIRPRVVNLAHALCSRARLGVISNTDPIHAAWIEKTSGLLPIIETWTYSFLEQSLKPDTAIYLSACEAMGIAPHRAVIIDDRAENCATAIALGMAAIQYQNYDQVCSSLSQLGLHP